MDQATSLAALKTEIARIQWWHTIDLGNGIVTPGADLDTREKLKEIHLPADLTGKSVLDVGAWDGFFSFEAEARGASHVLAVDSWMWNQGRKEGFELARRARQSEVEDKNIEVLDLSPETVGTFDLVLFLGVLYHMEHPLLALQKIAEVVKPGGMLILETHVDFLWEKRPVIAYYPGASFNNDPTNHCGPNEAAVHAMLREVGFARVETVSFYPKLRFARVSRTSTPYRAYNALKRLLVHREPFKTNFQKIDPPCLRMAFHAWK